VTQFTIIETPIPGLKVIVRKTVADQRGFLSRLFCSEALNVAGWQGPIAQINHTFTEECGTVRGMHFQYQPHSEIKLVSCIRGKVLDVVVDIRSDSPTFLQWYGAVLSAENQRALLIPEGFAHGFQALTDKSELIYLHSSAYSPNDECGLNPCDPLLAIQWPLEILDMSMRDRNHPLLDDNFHGLQF